jgi:hypothetical protein
MPFVYNAISWRITLELSFLLLELSIRHQLWSKRSLTEQASLITIIIYNPHIFIVQGTGQTTRSRFPVSPAHIRLTLKGLILTNTGDL